MKINVPTPAVKGPLMGLARLIMELLLPQRQQRGTVLQLRFLSPGELFVIHQLLK